MKLLRSYCIPAFIAACLYVACVGAQDSKQNPKYDPALAEKLGADEYGMRSYVFVVLKTGPTEVTDPEKSRELFAGHFSNMGRLAKEGKLVVSGPFIDARPKRGMYVFNVATLEEAEELVKTDPCVEAGIFDYELTKLYCSAALMQVGSIHETVQKTAIE